MDVVLFVSKEANIGALLIEFLRSRCSDRLHKATYVSVRRIARSCEKGRLLAKIICGSGNWSLLNGDVVRDKAKYCPRRSSRITRSFS